MELESTTCSFCSRSHNQAGRLVFGPNSVAVCHDCAVTALDIIRSSTDPYADTSVAPPARPLPHNADSASTGPGDVTALASYLNDVPFVSLRDEEELLRSGAEGLQHVTRSYLPLVAIIASKYANEQSQATSAMQETMLVLMNWIKTRPAAGDLRDVLCAMDAAAQAVRATAERGQDVSNDTS